jgi:hypothetical protein
LINLSPAFFDIQLRFAGSITRVSHFSFEEAIFRFTNIYLQCLGRSFDPVHPDWQIYLNGLRQTSDQALWTYAFYESRKKHIPPSLNGCFQYVYLADKRTIRPHFINTDTSGYGPLSRERMPARLQELKALFTEIRQRHEDTQYVRGVSWLYNLEAYKRLFPAQYTHAMEIMDGEFQYLALWGQFLQRDGQIREPLVSSFLSCCRRKRRLEDLLVCFPYPVLQTSCPIAAFYKFYECPPSILDM